jgi:hypothetical protein
MKTKRFHYARPCDDPAPGWCVEEVEIGQKGARWVGTQYEPVYTASLGKVLGNDWQKQGMAKAQAKREAELRNSPAKKAKK